MIEGLWTRDRISQRGCLMIALAIITAFSSPVIASDDSSLEEFGDWAQILLPVTAMGATWLYKDEEGFWMYAKQFGTAVGVSTALKFTASKLRPSSGDRTSWPSGHTMAAFSGASFLQTRYGWGWGIPAYIVAGLVGYSRIDADKHFADDVIAGASISLFSNWFWVEPLADNTTISPTVGEDGLGVQVQVKPGSGLKAKSNAERRYPYLTYTLGFGPAYLDKNQVAVPASNGTRFDLNNFRGRDDPTTTSVIQLDWGISPRHLWSFSFGPFEARDDGVFSQPVQFNGVTFPADETIQSAYRLYEARATYLYELLPDSQWTIRVGAGAAYQWTSMELLASDNVTYSEADDDRLLPLAVGRLGYSFNENWEIGVDAAGISLSDAEQFDVIVYGTWQMNYHWALSVGYEYYARQADNDTFFNDLRYDIPYIALSYTF